MSLNDMLRSLDGLSVGDAFGERFFGPPGSVAQRLERRELPRGEWQWTDDTAMARSLVEVLEEFGEVEQDALARAFARRFKAQPGRGYGRGAFDLLSAVALDGDWRRASSGLFEGQGSKGNGAAMRVAPLGAYFAKDLARVVAQARLSAEVTHWHEDAQAGAVAIAVAAALVVEGVPARELVGRVREHTPRGATHAGLVGAATLPSSASIEQAARELGSGQRVLSEDTVPFAVWCAARHLDSFEEAMWQTVSGLGDRDTTCAMVGGIVALRSPIPAAFLRAREPLRD